MTQEKKAPVIVLASGGLDSSLVMAKLLKEGRDVVPMFSNYNQYSYLGESRSVRNVVDWLMYGPNKGPLSINGVEKLAAYMVGDTNFEPSTFDGNLHEVVEVHIDTQIGLIAACPGRVLSFVGAACIWAFTNDWQQGEIAIGIHEGDKKEDSCRAGYQDSLNETVKSLTQDRMSIITPLMGMSREEMAKEIEEIGIPWNIMWNCYWSTPCGYQSPSMTYRCPGCRRKQESMRLVGRPESEWLVPNKNPSDVSNREIGRRDWKYK